MLDICRCALVPYVQRAQGAPALYLPDRKMQVMFYLCSIVLVPYVVDPTNLAAWMLMKSYFPATYNFYCGLLLLCYAGTVKQWNRWKSVSWAAAIIVIATMLLSVLNAWLPFGIMSTKGEHLWHMPSSSRTS